MCVCGASEIGPPGTVQLAAMWSGKELGEGVCEGSDLALYAIVEKNGCVCVKIRWGCLL